MGINKVQYGNTTLIDLTSDTVTADKLMQGYTAHDRTGAVITGTATGGGSGGNVWQDQDGYVHLDDEGGGSGGSSWELLASQEFTVSTESTSNVSVGTISLDLSKYNDPETMVWVHVRDKAGKRAGYVYGSDTIFFSYALANGNTNSLSIRPVMLYYVNSSDKYIGAASPYGVFAYRLYYNSSNHYVEIYSRYNTTYGVIDGTFKCDVYALKPPSGMKLFEIEE